ncbi:MAG: hypothetical protein K6E75_04255 [Lachnospiraceae bacterium]|nr:hypothetical protein [Lachnospiraceae bacterium]
MKPNGGMLAPTKITEMMTGPNAIDTMKQRMQAAKAARIEYEKKRQEEIGKNNSGPTAENAKKNEKQAGKRMGGR